MAGVRAANHNANGLGVTGEDRLVARNIDPGLLVHSGVGTLLLYGGWPLLLSALATVVFAIRHSFRLASSPGWVHPAFVGVLTMLAIYSISAAGLAGDDWVVGVAAIAVAIRSSAALEARRITSDTRARRTPLRE
jgi:hypothetical protein